MKLSAVLCIILATLNGSETCGIMQEKVTQPFEPLQWEVDKMMTGDKEDSPKCNTKDAKRPQGKGGGNSHTPNKK